MITKIFSLENNHSTEARWGQWIYFDCWERTIADFSKAGYCSGMVVVWIKKSIATNGRGIRKATDLGSLHLMGIVQSAYVKKTLFYSKALDYGFGLIYLLQSQNLIPLARTLGNGYCCAESIANWILSEPGHYIFLFFRKSGHHSVYNGHAIGFRYEGEAIEMLEPGHGLYGYSDQKSFVSHLKLFIQLKRTSLMGGRWYLYRVASDTEPCSLTGEPSHYG